MGKIFYADKSAYPASEEAVKKILSDFYGIRAPVIQRTEHGKPYLENGPCFSITHSENRLYIVFSEETVGIDAESLSRVPQYEAIIKKFSLPEREEISSAQEFLKHWVVKESAVKYFGSTLAKDLKNLAFIKGHLLYKNEEIPAKIAFLTHDGYILSVCGNGNFKDPVFIQV